MAWRGKGIGGYLEAEIEKTKLGLLPLLQDVGTHLYEVVSPEYATYCSYTSRIVKSVLAHFGQASELVPCQIWYCQPGHTYVIGFLGRPAPGKWDGHVVCQAGNWIVDTAVQHFSKHFGLAVPKVVVAPCFDFPTLAIAKWDVSDTDRVWWHPPPIEADAVVPEEPVNLIEEYARQLIARLELAGHASVVSAVKPT